jgi:hypothetical protein
VAIANEDAREAITDGTLQSNSLGNLIESIVIILAALSRRNCTIFPLSL